MKRYNDSWDLINSITNENFEYDDNDYEDLLNGYNVIRKDVSNGEELRILSLESIKDLEFNVKKEDAFGQSKTVIRRGKKNYFVLKYNG